MKCEHCEKDAATYNMLCIGCCARHCLMQFYPYGTDKWVYVADLAKRYGHDKTDLAKKIKERKIFLNDNANMAREEGRA